MDTRKHIHQEEFPISSEKMFKMLITPSDICGWWRASRAIVLPEENGIWTAAWGENQDEPDYVTSFVIKEFEPPSRILLTESKYHAKEGKLPFEANISAEFSVKPKESGCLLKVVQDGFPADPVADEYYSACEKGWKDTFESIRKHI